MPLIFNDANKVTRPDYPVRSRLKKWAVTRYQNVFRARIGTFARTSPLLWMVSRPDKRSVAPEEKWRTSLYPTVFSGIPKTFTKTAGSLWMQTRPDKVKKMKSGRWIIISYPSFFTAQIDIKSQSFQHSDWTDVNDQSTTWTKVE